MEVCGTSLMGFTLSTLWGRATCGSRSDRFQCLRSKTASSSLLIIPSPMAAQSETRSSSYLKAVSSVSNIPALAPISMAMLETVILSGMFMRAAAPPLNSQAR